MRKVSLQNYSSQDIEQLLKRIPFFTDVLNHSEDQFYKLMGPSEILEADPGETIIQKDSTGNNLYFLLKGQLAVVLDENPDSPAITYISPGEVFGMLSMVTDKARSAMIIADRTSKSTLVFKLDQKYFADESPYSILSLATKLIFFRMVVHNIRWKLEMNKMATPNHPLIAEFRKLPLISNTGDTLEDLQELKKLAANLADILLEWNRSMNQGEKEE